jgi:hypothetical protein
MRDELDGLDRPAAPASECRALVALDGPGARPALAVDARPAADFVTQLLASAEGVRAYRQKRRADPDVARARYAGERGPARARLVRVL